MDHHIHRDPQSVNTGCHAIQAHQGSQLLVRERQRKRLFLMALPGRDIATHVIRCLRSYYSQHRIQRDSSSGAAKQHAHFVVRLDDDNT